MSVFQHSGKGKSKSRSKSRGSLPSALRGEYRRRDVRVWFAHVLPRHTHATQTLPAPPDHLWRSGQGAPIGLRVEGPAGPGWSIRAEAGI